MTRTLQAFAAEQVDGFADTAQPDWLTERPSVIERWMHHLVRTCQVPDDILEAMPEVSRHNEPQVSPQEYDCGCVAITRITDRNGSSWRGRLEEPFEMRLALPCDSLNCALAHLRTT